MWNSFFRRQSQTPLDKLINELSATCTKKTKKADRLFRKYATNQTELKNFLHQRYGVLKNSRTLRHQVANFFKVQVDTVVFVSRMDYSRAVEVNGRMTTELVIIPPNLSVESVPQSFSSSDIECLINLNKSLYLKSLIAALQQIKSSDENDEQKLAKAKQLLQSELFKQVLGQHSSQSERRLKRSYDWQRMRRVARQNASLTATCISAKRFCAR